jgi:DNA invertase Pin-like site-specific DNA recombinase
VLAGTSRFERDLIRERTKSGLAGARARGVKLGRQLGQRPADRHANKVLALKAEGALLRGIANETKLAVNTVRRIVADYFSTTIKARRVCEQAKVLV